MKQNITDSTPDVLQTPYEAPSMEVIEMEVEDAVLAGGSSGGTDTPITPKSGASLQDMIYETW